MEEARELGPATVGSAKVKDAEGGGEDSLQAGASCSPLPELGGLRHTGRHILPYTSCKAQSSCMLLERGHRPGQGVWPLSSFIFFFFKFIYLF